VESKLSASTKNPGGDLIVLSNWYQRLGEEDKGVVLRVLRRWLRERDLHRAGIVFQFLADVEPLGVLEPEVLGYAEIMNELFMSPDAPTSTGHLWYDLSLYVWTLTRLRSETAVPWLKRWAQACTSSCWRRACDGATCAATLTTIDPVEGLKFAPLAVKSDLVHRPDSVWKGGRFLVFRRYVSLYLMDYADLVPLAEACAGLDEEASRAALLILQEEVAENLRLHRLGLESHAGRDEDWAREAIRSFRSTLGLAD